MLTQLPNKEDLFDLACHVTYQKIPLGLLSRDVEFWARRDDLIDETISGNKFYKLYFNLLEAKHSGRQIVSAGGAYSNHLHALAAAGARFGLQTTGLVRGERPLKLSATLQDAENWGMRLVFTQRKLYQPYNRELMLRLSGLTPEQAHYIPEGGCNEQGFHGTRLLGEAIAASQPTSFDLVATASGTGNTLAGIISGLQARAHRIKAQGISVLKGEASLAPTVYKLLQDTGASNNTNWSVLSGFHLGGYAKRLPSETLSFMQQFEEGSGIPLDPVYTVKLFWAAKALAKQGYWQKGSKVLLIHTGGLQGRRGFGLV